MKEKEFPNGFTSWMETHHEMVSAINSIISGGADNIITEIQYWGGTGMLYELAESYTDEFELLHKDREWDGEFFDEIDKFIEKKLEEK